MVSVLEAGAASRVSTVLCPASPALSPAHGHLTPTYLQAPTQQGCPTAPNSMHALTSPEQPLLGHVQGSAHTLTANGALLGRGACHRTPLLKPQESSRWPGVWCWARGVGAAQLRAGLGPCSCDEVPCHPPVSASSAALSQQQVCSAAFD